MELPSSSLSLPASLSQNWKHHVFASFHGADVRKTFLSHILESFRRKGIDPFIDSDIERSKSIGPELIEAIRGSKIAIVLLSRKYASSSWCLDELVEIMKCREELSQIVITIFYEVDPTEVKKLTGDFGKTFRKTCKGKAKEHIERWRKALEDVAKIAGEHSRNWNNEAAMIEKIATDVSNMLNISTPSRDFDGLVGMRAHMERMEQLLCLDLDEVRMIGIWGPPGIGKTTIARILFNQVSNRFQLGAIMVNIKGCYPRPCLDEYSAQLQLQNQMLSQMIDQKDIMISHLGVAQELLEDKKVFLVLDDVDQLGQLNALAKDTRWFGPGSRIIITTQDLRVLEAHGINHIYKVNFPSSQEAFQIFCMHAFGKMHPDDGFCELAGEVTNLAGELPLGLKVLGSYLRGMSKQEWKKTIPRLKTRLNGDIESIIMHNYNALCDDDKDLFLYLACLFNHGITHRVEEVLAKKFLDVRQGLRFLAERCLISINEFGRIKMHTLLVQFGRETSRKKFVHHGCQLLVDARDICEVLSDEIINNRRFIGINLDLSEIEEELYISEKAIERMSNLQFVRIHGNGVAHSERLQSLLYHSQKIRSLHWMNFQNICLPSTFNPEFLIELVMRDSMLHKLWEGIKPLRNLKWMDLSDSTDLKELPDLSTATNLEELILEGCSCLVELPSIGKISSLQTLDLSDCSSLVKLPFSIENANNLQRLDLYNCSNLLELPSIGNATKLEILDLSNCSSLVKLPSSINATNLRELYLNDCSRVVELPSIENATKLEILDLSNCSSLVELPSSINATNLRELYLNDCSSILELPSIGNATKLEILDLSNCSSLVKIPSSINATNLREMYLNNCSSVMELPAIKNATNLLILELKNCSSLLVLPPIGTATNLRFLDISGCSNLMKLPSSIGKLTNLKILGLRGCSSLVDLPSSLVKLPSSIENANNLQRLDLYNCSNLLELPSIGNATKLKWKDLSDSTDLKELPDLSTATNLQELSLEGCSSLAELPSSSGKHSSLPSSLVKLPSSIENANNLQRLDLYNCSNLLELPSIGNATKLKWKDLSDSTDLKELPDLSTATNLQELSLEGCSSLAELPSSSGKHSSLSTQQVSGGIEALVDRLSFSRKNLVEILALLNHSQSSDVKILGIWGMAGIGKTPIARDIFEILTPDYDLCYFLQDFHLMCQEKGLRQLRDDFLSKVCGEEKLSIGACETKLSFMRNRFHNKRILVVLDDISNARDAEALVGGFGWFSHGHTIILTSRRKQVLVQCKVKDLYEIQKLCESESFHLCKQYLNGETTVISELMSCSSGIPLSLNVLVSSVSKQDIKNMKKHLQSLRKNPPAQIQEAFRRSFDGLDEDEKNIFLDIACFFRGENKDHVVQLLDACGFFTYLGICDLIDESLISLMDNRIEMPIPFQDMGRFIVHEEDEDPCERSRLWDSNEIADVLTNNSGTEVIEGIFLDASDLTCELSPTVFEKMYNLRLLKFYCSTSGNQCKLSLPQGLYTLPDELRLLHWENYPLKILPHKFNPGNLVEMNMPYSKMEKLWEGNKNLEKLKKLKLSHSKRLTDIRMLSKAVKLEHIDLEGCTSLVDVSTSIPRCGKLVSLKMKDCSHLRSLPAMVDLTSLKLLNFSGCSELEEIQDFAPNLEELYLGGTAIKELPLLTENITKLVALDLENCRRLRKLPFGINSRSIAELKLSGCTSLEILP